MQSKSESIIGRKNGKKARKGVCSKADCERSRAIVLKRRTSEREWKIGGGGVGGGVKEKERLVGWYIPERQKAR
jgi:hypothetical protein